jgi:hypothetical protein
MKGQNVFKVKTPYLGTVTTFVGAFGSMLTVWALRSLFTVWAFRSMTKAVRAIGSKLER